MAPTSALPPTQPNPNLLRFTGHNYLRQRLVLSLISGKSIRIDSIRSDDAEPGLRDYEISFLRLLSKLTNGTHLEISYTGTSLLFRPGILLGGSHTHDCPLSRSIGYFLEPLVALGIWGKRELSIRLTGITTDSRDLGVDLIRTFLLPTMQLFAPLEGLELQILKRGGPVVKVGGEVKGGGGEVVFKCPVVRKVKTLNFVEPGRVRKIRGLAYSVRVASQFSNRLVESSRSLLNPLIPDIHIFTDHRKAEESGKSQAYGLSLVSTTTTGTMHCAEISHDLSLFETPEDVGRAAAASLLSDIRKGGCVGEYGQGLVLMGMVLGSEDVGRVRLGELSANSIQLLRDLRTFFSTTFKIATIPSKLPLTPEGPPPPQEYLLSCLGVGHTNVSKSVA